MLRISAFAIFGTDADLKLQAGDDAGRYLKYPSPSWLTLAAINGARVSLHQKSEGKHGFRVAGGNGWCHYL